MLGGAETEVRKERKKEVREVKIERGWKKRAAGGARWKRVGHGKPSNASLVRIWFQTLRGRTRAVNRQYNLE